MSKIEVLRASESNVFADEGDLLLCGKGVPLVISKPYHSALLAVLLENAGAADLIREAASEIEAEARHRYHWPEVHPAQQHKYERDVEIVAELRALLAVPKEGGG